MIRTLIVDDDPVHSSSLANLLKENFPEVELLAYCHDVPSAVQMIQHLNPQLLFLDIEMPPYTGFDLLEMVNPRQFEVIFTTSYQQYAIRAIKASALDYIEKPIDIKKLKEALARYKEKESNAKINNLLSNFKLKDENQKIALYDKGALNFFLLKDIIRCQSDNVYTEFLIAQQGKTQRIEMSKGIAHFEDFLVDKGFFFRVHNQHIINVNHIKRFVRDNGGYLIMDNDPATTIPIARSRKEDFISYLKTNGIII